MRPNQPDNAGLLLFDEALPLSDMTSADGFKSECPPDKKIKVENLFDFRRGRGDLQVSVVAAILALFFLGAFWFQTGWAERKLPDDLGAYLSYQLGLADIEGRVPRFGRILKQSWIIPMLCLLVLVPAALWNLRTSFKVHKWRQRFRLPTSAYFELTKYVAALEFVAYFIVYTAVVPILGYLVSTLLFGTFLTWRLGYRSPKWLTRGIICSFATVLLFRTFLQIKTPVSIWLYDQLPSAPRAFMLTYF